MDSVAKSNLYIENGQNHDCCGLTDLVFKDIDYSQYKDPISFFRSDFSRSRFYSCTFNRNSFGRADFIDVYIKNTEFESVDFGSCLNFDLSYIKSFPASAICISKYHINCDDAAIAQEFLENAFNSANHLLCGDAYRQLSVSGK